MNKFWESLQTPRSTARKRKPAPKYDFADLEKGEIFWYRSKGTIYGAMVLEKLSKRHYLVVLSEALGKEPKTTEEILNAPIYTAVWFITLLPTKRIHCLGKESVEGQYNGRAGLYLTESIDYCENFGYDRHWEHMTRSLVFPDMRVRDLLVVDNVPESFKRPEALQKGIELASRFNGRNKGIQIVV
ncbi:MAG: hypothetical protein IJA58_00590 [Lachnospiraceae bacterium]|nr:hypothetical protein [Lachnospiraceae bacterium]